MHKSGKLAFIGLGVMGYPMAGHLQNKGYSVTVFNRTQSKAARWVDEYGGTLAETPAEASKGADIVFVCVGNDDDVRSVVYGETGALSALSLGAILVDHTTTSATLALEISEACQKIGAGFIDAPVSGGQAGAENAALTIMSGASHKNFEAALPVLGVYAKKVTRMGAVGQGQRCKMVNQLCIAGVLQGLSEGLLLAEKCGLDISQIAETLQHGAAGSWQMSNRAETMSANKFDFGFAIDWMRKDLDIALEEAERLGLKLPLAHQVNEAYERLRQQGHGRSDTSALILDLRAGD